MTSPGWVMAHYHRGAAMRTLSDTAQSDHSDVAGLLSRVSMMRLLRGIR
jgi:hypothetical protein